MAPTKKTATPKRKPKDFNVVSETEVSVFTESFLPKLQKAMKAAAAGHTGLPVHIHGVEGIAGSLDLVFLDGMNLLTGNNEDGKTSATLATVVAAGGSIGRPLRANDSTGSGVVRGLGTVLTVGGRTTRTGAPSVELADYGTLGELIEPPGKTAATRDKRRVEILMDMVRTPVTPELLLEMAGGDEEIAGGVQGKRGEVLSLRAAMTAVKRQSEAVARDYEGRVKAAGEQERSRLAEVEKLKADIAGYPRPKDGVAGASGRLEAAIRDHERLHQQRQVRVARESERAQWGEMGEKPDVEGLRADWAKVSEEIGALEERLASLRDRQKEIQQEGNRQAVELAKWEKRSAAIEKPVDGPLEADVVAAAGVVEQAKADLDAAQIYEAIDAAVSAVKGHRFAATAAQKDADKRRRIARGVGAVVNRVIQAVDLGGLALDESDAHDADDEDGKGEARWRVCRVDEITGQLEPFERLSLGARTRMVLTGIGCKMYPGRVMPIEPGFWYALQLSRQRELVEVAIESGIKLISEIPTEKKGVTAVHLGEEWIGSGKTAEAYVLEKLGVAA